MKQNLLLLIYITIYTVHIHAVNYFIVLQINVLFVYKVNLLTFRGT